MLALPIAQPESPKPKPSPIIRSASLSACGQYRLDLTRTWRAGPHVCWCGLNPSDADHRVDDPTVKRWTHFTESWGYGGFVAVNLYPFRTPDPDACKRWSDWLNSGPDWGVRDTIWYNMDIVEREAKRADLFVACWGAGTWDDEYVEQVCETVTTGQEPWPDIYCLGTTMHGDPIHPMARGVHRVANNQQPVLWRQSESRRSTQ